MKTNLNNTHKLPSLYFLLGITLVNYLAQIPYYLHNYYVPHHLIPSVRAVGLLGFTLIWFVIGYTAYIRKIKYGYAILLSYLVVQALFYGMTCLSGAAIMQLHNHSNIIRAVFLVGYTSGFVAAYYSYKLIRFRIHSQTSSVKTI